MKQVTEILQLHPSHYEALLLDNYFLWCDLNAYDETHLQALIHSNTLFNWWQTQNKYLEADFLKIVKPYVGLASKKTIRALYTEETAKLRQYYPKPLIDAHRPKYATRNVKRQTKRAGHFPN